MCCRGRGDECSSSRIGYDPARVIEGLDGTDFSTASADSAKVLTRVMVLHPIATGLAFIAFLLCAGSGIIGSFLSSIVSLLTFVVALVALICDFVGFSIIKRHVNDNDATASRAYWGAGIWLILVSGIFLLIGAAIVFVTCCFGRKKRDTERHKETWNDAPATGGRRRFW